MISKSTVKRTLSSIGLENHHWAAFGYKGRMGNHIDGNYRNKEPPSHNRSRYIVTATAKGRSHRRP